jgi:hypothetical protein
MRCLKKSHIGLKKVIMIIRYINNVKIIRRLLENLGLWLASARAEPRAHSPAGGTDQMTNLRRKTRMTMAWMT